MTTLAEIVVIGNTNTDLVCESNRLPLPGETVTGNSFAEYAGGKAANQAVAAARAGAKVQFIGCIGNDDFGRDRLDDLKRADVGVEHVQQVDHVTSGIAMIVVDNFGQNQIVVAPGANQLLDAEQVIAACLGLEAETIICLTLESPIDVIEAIIVAFAGKHRIICNAAPFNERIRKFSSQIDFLILNEIEAGDLIGLPITIGYRREAIEAIQEMGFKNTIITLGEQGVVFGDDEQKVELPALLSEVVDSTGAGDAFCGVFAAWLAQGETMHRAVQAGLIAGSLAVRQRGAQPSMPDRAKIMTVLNNLDR